MENYSEKIARIIAASGLSQHKVADRLGFSIVTLNRWANGKATPRPAAMRKIDLLYAEFLGSDEIEKSKVAKIKKIALTKKFSLNKLVSSREILDRLTVNLTYHSNATEGSTMTEKDVEAVIFDNKVLKNRTAIEQREAINHQTALHFLLDELQSQGRDFSFTPDLVKATHLRLTNGVMSDAGEYRRTPARIRGANVPLANFIKIPELVKLWCDRANEETADVITKLAVSHAEFEKIHPFADGNGRTGRLLMFVMALHLKIVPPVLKKERRSAYYKYLALCQTRELSDPLEKIIAEAIIETSELIEK